MTLAVESMADVDSLAQNRRRGHDEGQDASHEGHDQQHDSGEPSQSQGDTVKRRKRTRKGDAEKKFECKHEGCGKSYSRAEHLYRHQLNHTPKHIYRCDFPDCYRSFVRQDLCVRHRERHTTHGSQLQKRDNFAHAANTLAVVPPQARNAAPAGNAPNPSCSPTNDPISPYSKQIASGNASGSMSRPRLPGSSSTIHVANAQNYSNSATVPSAGSSSSTSIENHFQPLTPQQQYAAPNPRLKRSDSTSSYTLSPQRQSASMYGVSNRQPVYGKYDGQRYQTTPFSPSELDPINQPSDSSPNLQQRRLSSTGPILSGSTAYMSATGLTTDANLITDQNTYIPQQNLHISSLPQPGYSNPSMTGATSASIANAISSGLNALDPSPGVMVPGSSVSDWDALSSYALPIFGGETLNRSPFAMTDDFTAWLFNEHSNNNSPIAYSNASGMIPNYADPVSAQFQGPYYPSDVALTSYFTNVVQPQHPMSVTSLLDTGPPQSIISEEKRNELLELIQTRFNETNQAAVKKRKDALLDGDLDADWHLLSLRMMQTYIASYWYRTHDQLPILHKPTFSADKTPNLLLLAIMAIGASTLDKGHGHQVTEAASDLANFLAWHIRWEIFMDVDFQPPAKLWVFQTLLLLEICEKLYSTRALHERAHIHHDTTLTLMRRGSSLIGRSAFDSPPSLREDRQNRSATGSGTNSASESGAGEESWAHWIKAEATRRVAFAAFVLDSTHATMFGHSAKMVAHEMRLPLPCDEALWSATSAAEVARVQSSLHSNGVKAIMFLDGLKKTLNGQKVRTNSFGRTILMAGLLSVSWHMNQRDLQVSSLGVAQALGGRDRWRSSLLRSYDNWKRDFDDALAESNPSNYSNAIRQFPMDDDIIFESRTVLHHLAHMASHVDVVDCQIFAGAGRLLGRSITPKDYSTAREKMVERWANKAAARDAAFFALKFLTQVLLSDDGRAVVQHGSVAYMELNEYSARDDFLLNRPWVIYFAALVVWSYGYALDGAINAPVPELSTPDERRKDMYEFLDRVGGVRTPEELLHVHDRNRCMGLLMILQETFSYTRWELLHEAANLLGSCIEKLKGSGAPSNSS
ncbi:C2H2 finger domain-containing protein [Blastomyces dermatitidis ER-3]|uniref:C2H2 finger domain-containing protein n=1 Tax=Ajellomyces dermatitidis (strain ER-3 / ATCC MYA-2586) TaxID=559297 RepID=A0ABP2F3Q6_AJEDR|nr:C2H2 finger domain-containing protein [Blastomyces dermatitidis ER-3]EEQ91257.2 C2H2 finger domain-containing protein [Blastomyces dermatitidis ER-3]